jgi:hypothetical protein
MDMADSMVDAGAQTRRLFQEKRPHQIARG